MARAWQKAQDPRSTSEIARELHPRPFEFAANDAGGAMLLIAQFWVLVEIAPKRLKMAPISLDQRGKVLHGRILHPFPCHN